MLEKSLHCDRPQSILRPFAGNVLEPVLGQDSGNAVL